MKEGGVSVKSSGLSLTEGMTIRNDGVKVGGGMSFC